MSLALYIVLDAEDPGFDTYVDGKAIANVVDELSDLCEEAGLPLLDTFVGQSSDELEETDFSFDEEDANDDFEPDEEGTWFDAAEGVAWLQAVMEVIDENPDALDDVDGVLSDLGDFQHILEKAQAARLRWHFAWDF